MHDHDHGHDHGYDQGHAAAHPDDAEAREWDGFYAGNGDDRLHWSGQPNATLVTEAAALAPGRALDVGCGEGGDAVWLAGLGWQVTAIDPSGVALERGRRAARAAGVAITWLRVGLLDLPGDAGAFDLVTAHYPVLRRAEDDAAMTALLRVVVPGGTLLFVHHDLDPAFAAARGFDPSAHVMPASLATHLDDDWEVEVSETRDRSSAPASEHPHPGDIVLRARRRAEPRRDRVG